MKNTNTFLIVFVWSVVLLFTMFYFGINSNIKGTYSDSEFKYYLLAPNVTISDDNCTKVSYTSCSGLSNYTPPNVCWYCPNDVEYSCYCYENDTGDVCSWYSKNPGGTFKKENDSKCGSDKPQNNPIYALLAPSVSMSDCEQVSYSSCSGLSDYKSIDELGNCYKCTNTSDGETENNNDTPSDNGNNNAETVSGRCWHCNGIWKWQIDSGSGCQYPDTSINSPESCAAKNINNTPSGDGNNNDTPSGGGNNNDTPSGGGNNNDTSSGDGNNNDTPSNNVTKTFEATFDANGGTLNGNSSKSCSTSANSCSITGLPIASKDGYTFNGWGTISSCLSGITSSLTLDDHTTYYACYVGNSTVDNEIVEENPVTGPIAIAITWFVGIFAIAYSVFYFKKIKEN